MLISLQEAQSALQAQMKLIAESQDAKMNRLQLLLEEAAKSQKSVEVAVSESDDLQLVELDSGSQQELQPATGEDSDGRCSRSSPPPSI